MSGLLQPQRVVADDHRGERLDVGDPLGHADLLLSVGGQESILELFCRARRDPLRTSEMREGLLQLLLEGASADRVVAKPVDNESASEIGIDEAHIATVHVEQRALYVAAVHVELHQIQHGDA